MGCNVLTNDKGKVTGFICGSSWGMGVTEFPDATDEEKAEGYDIVYGFAMGGDPHNFSPDYEWNSKAEIQAWKDAKAACKCGREPEATND
jgi:hypothetical protein